MSSYCNMKTDQPILTVLFRFIQYVHFSAHIVKKQNKIRCGNYFYFYLLYIG